jgi:AcrR family transcriptional regulator
VVPAPTAAAALLDEQRDRARARILEAAYAVLAHRGLSTTMDDVAAAAGVNRRTVFRHFATRDGLLAAAIADGVRRSAQQVPPAPAGDDLRGWLRDLLLVTHRLNAASGRILIELAAVPPDELSPELAQAVAERRRSRRRFAVGVASRLWQAHGRLGRPPTWVVDAVAVHLSGFTTQALARDFGRTPAEVAQSSAQVLDAILAGA